MVKRAQRNKKNNGLKFDNHRITHSSWFSREGWEKLSAVSSDNNFDEPYDQWVKSAEYGDRQLTELGLTVIKREIDVDDLLDWCKKHRRRFNSRSLARYLNDKYED